MRKVILGMSMSLDGFIAGPNGELNWVTWDQEIDNVTLSETLPTVDTALLGRELYQGFLSYWPSKSSFFSKGEEEFARWINDAPKVVFSRTLETVEWNSRLVKDNIAEEVAKLKQEPGKDMLLFGGAGIAQTFVQLGLVDEYSLVVHPVALGNGRPLFKDLNDITKLKLLRAKTFDVGALWLHYEPNREPQQGT